MSNILKMDVCCDQPRVKSRQDPKISRKQSCYISAEHQSALISFRPAPKHRFAPMEPPGSSDSGTAVLFVQIPSDAAFLEMYTIGVQLGEGGNSRVNKARNVKTHQEVAVKVVSKQGLPRGTVELEARILQMCGGSPLVVQLLAAYESPKNFYLVQEWILGGDLFDRIVVKEKYSEADARVLMYNILSAISFIHSKNIAHRDVKPENILLVSASSDVDIKLSDFGLAKMANLATDLGRGLMTPCGTPGYVAPEIAEHQPYDKSVDCWAAGVIMYTVMCGYPPFWASTPEKLLELVAQGQFVFHAKAWKGTSRESRELIKGLLRKNASKRLTADQALHHVWFTHLHIPHLISSTNTSNSLAAAAAEEGSSPSSISAVTSASSCKLPAATPLSSSVSLVSASPDFGWSRSPSLSQLLSSGAASNVSVCSADETPQYQETPPRSFDDVNVLTALSNRTTGMSLRPTESQMLLAESPPASPTVALLNESPPEARDLTRVQFAAAIDFQRERPVFLHAVTESNLWERRRQKKGAAAAAAAPQASSATNVTVVPPAAANPPSATADQAKNLSDWKTISH